MVDINNVELNVGDDVVYTNRNLNELHKGKVFKITKDRIIIQLRAPTKYSSNLPDGTVYNWTSKYEHIITSSSQIMKLG